MATYGRDANATWQAFEEVLGGLEGGTALAFASGMAATAAVIESLPVGAVVVMPGDAYQGVRLLLQDLAAKGRIGLRTADIADTEATLAICREAATARSDMHHDALSGANRQGERTAVREMSGAAGSPGERSAAQGFAVGREGGGGAAEGSLVGREGGGGAAEGSLVGREGGRSDVSRSAGEGGRSGAEADSRSGGPRAGSEMFGAGGLLWLESPTNPLLAVADIEALTAGAHQAGLSVAVDNTFATPLLQRPLDLGADVVVHSVTKLLAGHSDVVMGAAVTRDPGMVDELTRRRSLHGAIPGPLETLLALRGMRTLAVRIERAQATAGEIARRLEARSGVRGVRYPGLPGHPGRERVARQMRGPGTMLSFEVAGGASAADAVCESVRLITPGTSLGGVETLIERRAKYPAEAHLPAGLLRLSVGLEHVDDLWADLDRALTASAGSVRGAD